MNLSDFMKLTWNQRLSYALCWTFLHLFGRWMLVHDSWSPPKTEQERELFRARLEHLQSMGKEN